MSEPKQEVQPRSDRWWSAPRSSCDHDRVAVLTDPAGQPSDREGKTALWCRDCEEIWWEDKSNVYL